MGVPKDGNEVRVGRMVVEAVRDNFGAPYGPLIVNGTLTDAGGGASFLVKDEGGSHKTYQVIVREFRP